jgi:hypothetical protein
MKIKWIHGKWVFLALFFLLFACTRKKNQVGVPDSGIIPIECHVTTQKLSRFYSFEDSLSTADSNKLTCGNFKSITSYSLIKFLQMPDSTNNVENVNLKMIIKNSHEFEESNLKIGKLQTFWKENKATWHIASDSTTWNSDTFSEADYEEIAITHNLQSDTLLISLPNEIVLNWIAQDSTNFGLVFYMEPYTDNTFVEFFSTETTSFPILTFDYFHAQQDSMVSFTSSNNLASDTVIYKRDEAVQLIEGELRLANMFPTRMYLKFDITADMFINPVLSEIDFLGNIDTGIYTEHDFKRMNIIKAELVLTRKIENDYLLRGDLRPYLVVDERLHSENVELPITYPDDYILYGKSTNINELQFQHKIDITTIVQTLTSGNYDNSGDTFLYENQGFIIKSTNDNYDLQYLDFYTSTAENEAYRPYLKIIYIPPFE